MTTLKIHSSLSRKKEEFIPADPNHVRMYACGPTVYNYAHIGNARMAVVFDLLASVMREIYPKVTYVSNITDIDDKIINASCETGEPIEAITLKYERIYNEDMAVLGVQKPDIQPRATQYIPEMINLIQLLIKRGHAYEAEGHVLFNVPSYSNYGALSRRNRDDQIAGARVEVAPFKKDPADFVLWKPSTDDQPGWDSPWGFGRPGWHIECSAMSEANLGLPFDIHGGGADLIFPHHENEIAQTCGAYGFNRPESFAGYWFHNGFVTVEGEKMSKSIGNIRLVHDLIEHHPGEALRLALLSAHYRQPLNWTEEAINQARKTLDRFYRTLKELEDVEATSSDIFSPVMEALCDDLNTPKVLAELGKILEITDSGQRKGTLIATGNLLGLLQQDPDKWLGYSNDMPDAEIKKIETLIQQRKEARNKKDFKRADKIRDELQAMNIEIEDKPCGDSWRRIKKEITN